MEQLIGRVHEGLWLAASACPSDSSMLRHSIGDTFTTRSLLGEFIGGLWLAPSACPYDSDILRLLADEFLYAPSKDPLEGDAR